MALINRATRLFRADLHAVLDRIEEPDILLRQAVREMQDDIDRDERSLESLVHEHTQLQERLRDLDASLAEIEPQLDTCLTADEDDLARVLIRRRLGAHKLRQLLAHRQQRTGRALGELRRRLEDNRQRLIAMRQKVQLVATDDADTRSDEQWPTPELAVSDADVEVALLQEKRRRANS